MNKPWVSFGHSTHRINGDVATYTQHRRSLSPLLVSLRVSLVLKHLPAVSKSGVGPWYCEKAPGERVERQGHELNRG